MLMSPLQKLQAIFRDFFDDSTMVITPETSHATIPDWDSVAQVHIVLAVEEAFEMRFTTDQVAHIQTVADILTALQGRA
jgi:acyl carrier protein